MVRKFYLDFLKVLATFGVIFMHVSGKGIEGPLNTYNWHVAVVGNSLVRWSVPIFVMISGALFLNPLKGLTITLILKKYVKRLLIAYIFWYIVYCFFYFVRAYITSDSIELDAQLFEPAYHLWFLPMLMGVYLLVPFLRHIAGDNRLLIYALILWAVYLFISYFQFLNYFQISYLFTRNIVVSYAGYFLLGYFLSLDRLSRHQRFIIYVLGGVGVTITISGSIISSLSLGFVYTKYLNEISPQVLLMATALFVFVKRQSPKIEIHLKRFTDYVRKDLFGIYLVHIAWHSLIGNDIVRNMCNQAISLVIITILIFFFSLYTTKILRKIPFIAQFVE